MADQLSPFQPTFDCAQDQLRLFLPANLSKSLVLDNLTLIAKPTNSVLHGGTISRSLWGSDPLQQPLKVVYKSFDHRAMRSVRRGLGIPYWNTRREAIYRSLSVAEVKRRLKLLPRGYHMFIIFKTRVEGRYTQLNGRGRYLDHSAEVINDGLVADEELFIQKACHMLWKVEVDNYRALRHEQGRAIPYFFGEFITPALQGILEPKLFLTTCPGLLLEGIRGCTVQDSLSFLSQLPGQNVGPLLSKAFVTLNILLSHKIWLGDIQLRNMMLCTRSLAERRKDIEEYTRVAHSAAERGGYEQGTESIICGDELPTFEGCPAQVIPRDEEQNGPVNLISFSQATLACETSHVVFIDLEVCGIEENVHELAEIACSLVDTFKEGCDIFGIPPSVSEKMDSYMDGRYVKFEPLEHQVMHETQRIRDIMMAALCWEQVSPMDSMEKYSTCYNISQRGWKIMSEEITLGGEKQDSWWRQAVRRIAAELFSDDPDKAESRFASFLGAAPATTSSRFAEAHGAVVPRDDRLTKSVDESSPTGAPTGNPPGYLLNGLPSTPLSPLSSEDEISIATLFTKSKDTWRLTEGPPPLYIPA